MDFDIQVTGGAITNSLASAREASGWASLTSTPPLQLSGTATMAGTEGTFTMILDSRGRFAQRIAGPISVATGFDGERCWVEDIGGERRLQELSDRESTILAGLLMTGQWMAPQAPLKLEPAPDAADGGHSLRFTLVDGELAGTIELDPASQRIRKASYSVGAATHTLAFSGEVRHGGIVFPAKVERSSSTGISTIIHIDHADKAPDFIRSPFEPVLSPPDDVSFDAKAPAALEIKKAPTGHLLVHPTVSGKNLGWFIFDSGAGSNCLDARAAEALGAEKFGQVPAIGIGGHTNASFARPESLTLGPATLDHPLLVVMDLAFLDGPMREKIAGIIGYGLLHRVVAEIDMEGPSVSLHNPATYDAARASWSPLAIDSRAACVQGEFEGHKGWFRLDTGAGSSFVQMHAPAVERFKLLDGRTTLPTANGGVGGAAAAQQGVLRDFTLGGRRTENVPATFATEAKGAFATPYTLGNIGGGLLRPFTLVMDYQHNRIAFVERK